MERIVFIDIAKALCIISVVIGHYNPEGAPKWWVYLHDLIYAFHMPLFMFASGFVYIATRKIEQVYGDFIMKKIKRLMIPYFVVSTIVISLKLLTENHVYVENPKTMMSFVRMFYLPEAGYFLWFIWALWWMFVILPFFRTKSQRMILLAASILLYYVPFNITDIFCFNQFKAMLIYFVLGVCFYDWKSMFSKLERIPTIIYVALFLIIFNVYGSWGGYRMVVPFLGIAATISFAKLVDKSNVKKEWLMIISTSSYIIYLFHTTFEGFAKAVVFKVPYLQNMEDNMVFGVGALFIVACGVFGPIILCKTLFKRYVVTRVLFGLK